jgi:hypothetical protein
LASDFGGDQHSNFLGCFLLLFHAMLRGGHGLVYDIRFDDYLLGRRRTGLDHRDELPR